MPCIKPCRGRPPAPHAARLHRVRRRPLRAPFHPVGGPPVQPAPQGRLSGHPPALDQDQRPCRPDWQAPRSHADGRPGFIRIDSVHQGDQDGVKGLYHINAVDCVTQFEIVATCERLSEAYLLPVLSRPWPASPSRSWASTPTMARSTSTTPWLSSWRSSASSSPSRAPGTATTTVGGNQERRHRAQTLGLRHIPQRSASAVNAFCQAFLNPYVNFHRPCFFADTVTTTREKPASAIPSKT